LLLENRRLAFGLVVLALLIKALIPSGYMLSERAGHVLTVTICGDASGQPLTKQIEVPARGPMQGPMQGKADHAKAEPTCAWGLLAMAALGGADVVLLAAALAFILALGLAASRPALPSRRAHLRPPLRGPPAFA
jgi:hypothetical protein